MGFTFSDTIAGVVTASAGDTFTLQTADGRDFQVRLTSNTFAELCRNLGEPYLDATGQMADMCQPGRWLFTYGVFYPEGGDFDFDAKHIVFLGRSANDFVFERPNWWIKQIRELATFYLRAEFGDGEIDYRQYRTSIDIGGRANMGTYRQETDTISRLVYGFATAYLLTGEDRFLEAAEKGTEYLRAQFRTVDASEGIAYWAHGIDVVENTERKILASEFGDDYDAIPAYEQIYALAGPTQTFRATGDPKILSDIDMTIALFNRFFLDPERGGFYSHLDPITFDGKSESLGRNRGKKNWNSVGDHAPAYLINAYLGTGREDLADFLAYTADTIVDHFVEPGTPFVNERFHEDWSYDQTWRWQQNRAVVWHHLKIAWNLMRIQSVRPSDKYVDMAKTLAETMPDAGSDKQRWGWYDVVDRFKEDGKNWYRYAWHDRKAWWQQEQAILAYLILQGILGGEEYQNQARRSIAFYNAWFLDHDAGGVYFNVLANGLPYLLGTERFKGSHSMSGYHAFELCYLAAVYQNLLVTKQPLDLYFKPKAHAFPDRILRVAPDILPAGSVKIEEVLLNGQPWSEFNAEQLTVTLPPAQEVTVKVRLVSAVQAFESNVEITDGTATVTLAGRLDGNAIITFERDLERALSENPKRVVLRAERLESISSAGTRALVFLRQKLPT